jgi:hypothetical protein
MRKRLETQARRPKSIPDVLPECPNLATRALILARKRTRKSSLKIQQPDPLGRHGNPHHR